MILSSIICPYSSPCTYSKLVYTFTGNSDSSLSFREPPKLARGDTAICRFRFLFRPEFLKVGAVLVIREGRTTGVGKIVGLDVLQVR